jgi:ketosteroid isomerase-like protein
LKTARRLLLAVSGALALAAALPIAAQEAPEKALLEVEGRRRVAIGKGDLETLKKIYAEDFRGVVGTGRPIERAELLDMLSGNDPKTTFDADEIAVRVFGDAAVVTGRLTGTKDGAKVSESRYVHVYVRRPAGWQCVFGQSTPVK